MLAASSCCCIARGGRDPHRPGANRRAPETRLVYFHQRPSPARPGARQKPARQTAWRGFARHPRRPGQPTRCPTGAAACGGRQLFQVPLFNHQQCATVEGKVGRLRPVVDRAVWHSREKPEVRSRNAERDARGSNSTSTCRIFDLARSEVLPRRAIPGAGAPGREDRSVPAAICSGRRPMVAAHCRHRQCVSPRVGARVRLVVRSFRSGNYSSAERVALDGRQASVAAAELQYRPGQCHSAHRATRGASAQRGDSRAFAQSVGLSVYRLAVGGALTKRGTGFISARTFAYMLAATRQTDTDLAGLP